MIETQTCSWSSQGRLRAGFSVKGGGSKCFRFLRAGEFSGELNLFKHAEVRRRSTNDIDESAGASLSNELAGVDAC